MRLLDGVCCIVQTRVGTFAPDICLPDTRENTTRSSAPHKWVMLGSRLGGICPEGGGKCPTFVHTRSRVALQILWSRPSKSTVRTIETRCCHSGGGCQPSGIAAAMRSCFGGRTRQLTMHDRQWLRQPVNFRYSLDLASGHQTALT